jgi:hypothetical protein
VNRLHAAAFTLLSILLAGCAVSSETTAGQFSQIKRNMTREQVIGSLGDPALTNSANGTPSEDLYACDEQGQIMVVRESRSLMIAEDFVFPLWLVDGIKLVRVRKSAVNYIQGKVVSTSQTNDIVFTK